ncbi:MAG: dihydrolipoyl dehydrogenase [Verrucomicrobiota bacterium]|nr:dihydrolipoyl dehydrogenase [Verrucomicrobiota bacterium]
MDKKKYDIAVIGAGPGGYTAAIRAAQLGKSVALIEKDDVGGTCLNVGCIPTKTLISNAALLHQMRRASLFGIQAGPIAVDYPKMKERKDRVVQRLRGGIQGLLQANRIELFKGSASFLSSKEIQVKGEQTFVIEASKTIIATGSIPLEPKAFPCNHPRIVNSTSLLELTEIPKRLIVIGGGYIGCEFASLFREFGSEVTILEAMPSILALQGPLVAQFMTRTFTTQGIRIETNVFVEGVRVEGNEVVVSLRGGKEVRGEYALVAVGRKIFTEGLQLEKAGVKTTDKGAVSVNADMQTSVSGIYAIGDVTGKEMLAHTATHQGLVAASHAAGSKENSDARAIPAVIFTLPEIAMVGKREEEARAAGLNPTAVTFPFQALGKAHASMDTEGFAHLVIDAKSGEILGATMIGHEASNMISEIALAIQNELTVESLIETIHPHPTLSEAWHESALLAVGHPLHLPPGKKT